MLCSCVAGLMIVSIDIRLTIDFIAGLTVVPTIDAEQARVECTGNTDTRGPIIAAEF